MRTMTPFPTFALLCVACVAAACAETSTAQPQRATPDSRITAAAPPSPPPPKDDCSLGGWRDASAPLYKASGLDAENAQVEAFGLARIRNFDELAALVGAGALVPVSSTLAYSLDLVGSAESGNADALRHALPDTRAAIDDLLSEMHRCTGVRWALNSIVRPMSYQKRLKRHSRAAAPPDVSTHPTGATFDVGTTVDANGDEIPMAARMLIRKRVGLMETAGLVEAIQEPRGCLHVMVLPGYSAARYLDVRARAAALADQPVEDAPQRPHGHRHRHHRRHHGQ